MFAFVVLYYRKGKVQKKEGTIKTDYDTLKETYRFVRSEVDDDELQDWELRLAKKYYDKLYKEYCIADLKYYEKGKVGMRWRSEKEVIIGKGQFTCGERKCDNAENLHSYEVLLLLYFGGCLGEDQSIYACLSCR